MMTRQEALDRGYCKHCAAYDGDRGWKCGVTIPPEKRDGNCIMPADVQVRFREERGLEGETQRYVKPQFGDPDLIKKRGRKKRRIFR